ncbi:hypothetical protein CKM354_000996700 [Cercospora kikuchii]|uniref:Uncharacterized protein n=1 Tax=Cercospora kikuchii TaxID=84275 RepID=A0A9P3CYE7_9PEZI|nr:uncharacterized protein CKM354_000996700 [Cercospora kikuchii]GIZ46858.1 hypothetical protein CKM354_000996700 [Cercospora kikuchii]
MAASKTANSNGGWTVIHARGESFKILNGPTENVEMVHLVVHCDWSITGYGVNMPYTMATLAIRCPETKRIYVQLSFGNYRTSVAEAVQFGSSITAFVKAALAAEFCNPCPVFMGVTDVANPVFKVTEHVEAMGQDRKDFTDDPAAMIMYRRGSAINVGTTQQNAGMAKMSGSQAHKEA